VFSYSIAVAFFILSSLMIGLKYQVAAEWVSDLAVILFLAGMISVFIGVLFAAREIRKGHQIVKIEISNI